MGRDKASLRFGDETLLARVVRIVGTVTRPVVVVAAAGQTVPALPSGIRIARDPVPDRGPLQGVAVGLATLAEEVSHAFVVPTDAPLLEPAFVKRMAQLAEGHDVAVPVVDGRHEVLAAVYATALHVLATQLLDQGQRRLVALLDQVRVNAVDGPTLLADPVLQSADPELASLRNLNTWEDYQLALAQVATDAD